MDAWEFERSGCRGFPLFQPVAISATGRAFGKKGGFYCAGCGTVASPDNAELFEQTPNLQGEPLVFVDPEHVNLTAEVAAIKETYKDGVVKVLDSELKRDAKKVAVSRLNVAAPFGRGSSRQEIRNAK